MMGFVAPSPARGRERDPAPLDALRGHVVKAYVVLWPSVAPYPTLADEIVDVVKTRVGHHQQPREVEGVDQLPKTEAGEIQRFVLRQR